MTSPLQHAITTIKSGDHKTGQQLLTSIIHTNPNDEHAWLWMSSVVTCDEDRRQCMEKVLAINPANTHAQRGLIALLTRWSSTLATQHQTHQLAQQQLATDRAALEHEQALLTTQREQLDTDRATLEQAQTTLRDQQAQLATDRATLKQDQQKLADREQHIQSETHRLQTWSDQLTEREWNVWQQEVANPQHTILEPLILEGNIYFPPRLLEDLFEERIKEPYNQARKRPYWQSEDIHGQAHLIIDKGRADFCEPYMELSPDDLVLIYCYTNMRMHFYSNYHILNVHREALQAYIVNGQQRILFVDIGCGPFTCGLAFNAFTHGLPNKPHITYIGVDRAPAMVAKAAEFNQHGGYVDRFDTCTDYNDLPAILHQHISDQEQLVIIFSMSYFFASKTLDVSELAAVIYDLTETYNYCPIIFIRQDPNNFSPSEKGWIEFSQYFEHFHSVGKTTVEMFKYTSDKERFVKYNILTNQSCGNEGNNNAIPTRSLQRTTHRY